MIFLLSVLVTLYLIVAFATYRLFGEYPSRGADDRMTVIFVAVFWPILLVYCAAMLL